jgi:hypothetical protein
MVERFDAWLRTESAPTWSVREEVEKGVLPARYAESSDPERRVPVFLRPEWIEIVVAGLPAHSQCRGFVNNHEQGWPVTKEIRLPVSWDTLRAGS